jgi:hypothetical protein
VDRTRFRSQLEAQEVACLLRLSERAGS